MDQSIRISLESLNLSRRFIKIYAHIDTYVDNLISLDYEVASCIFLTCILCNDI